MIKFKDIYIDPSRIFAVSQQYDSQQCVVEDKCIIWLGPAEADCFMISMDIKDVADLINGHKEEVKGISQREIQCS